MSDLESLKSVLIDVVTPCDQVIAAWASAKVGAEPTSSSTGLPSERIATQPVAAQDGVEQPAAHHAAGARDLLDVPVDVGVDGEQVAPVDRDLLALELDQVHVLGGVGQEDLAGARDLHEVLALAGQRLLHELRHAAGARVLEGHVALVGDHRALLGADRALVEADLQQVGVLQGEGVGRRRLIELREGRLHGPTRCRPMRRASSGRRGSDGQRAPALGVRRGRPSSCRACRRRRRGA